MDDHPRRGTRLVFKARRMIDKKKFILDLARHMAPLVSLYFLDGSIPRYLLLTAFNLSLGLMLIVGLTREASDPTTVDPRAATPQARLAAVVILSIFLAVVAAIITVPISSAALIMSMADDTDWGALFSHKPFWVMVAFVSLIAGLRGQLGFEATTTVGQKGTAPQAAPVVGDIAQDRKRSKADYAAQVTLIATFVFLSFLMANFGSWGFYTLPIAYTALLVFFDTRPDIGRKIFPEMWREEKAPVKQDPKHKRKKR
ncbi:MAG: hypothetical protein JNN20_07840 [Betaproteobacteria bacterium]|nr:hypothetical protein [Betaproteobacteria bacterium]